MVSGSFRQEGKYRTQHQLPILQVTLRKLSEVAKVEHAKALHVKGVVYFRVHSKS